MRVFFHTKQPGTIKPSNTPQEFSRLPIVGEYVTLKSDGEWYKVEVVVHCPFNHGTTRDYEAEVFAVPVDHNQVLKGWATEPPTELTRPVNS